MTKNKYYILLFILIILAALASGVIIKRSYQTDKYFDALRLEGSVSELSDL